MTENNKIKDDEDQQSNLELEKAQEAYYEACSQQGSDDENTEGVRILAAAISIGKWLRSEHELTHIEIWRQAFVLARVLTAGPYGLSEEQLIGANNVGVGLAKAYFEDAPSNYRGFMKSLGVAGVGDELSPEGKGDLITVLQAFLLVIEEYETEDVIEKYTKDINATCIHQLEGGGILDQTKDNASQVFDDFKERLLNDYPVPSGAPKQKEKRKKKNKYEKIEIMLRTMALIAVYVAGSDRKSSEDPIDEKEAKVAIEVSGKMFESEEWQDRLFFRDLKPDELEKTTLGWKAGGMEFIRADIGNDRDMIFDELKDQVNLLKEHYTYSEEKDWDNWDREEGNNTQFMVHFATNVANASGGILGFGKISKKEKESITNVYKIMSPDDSLYEQNVEFRIDEILKMIKKGECTY